ncbi:MAG: membrane protein insertase YidC [Bacteroidales bacterium]|nr:membrane protein insertase YidC [Bacteroidales bacterium]
MDKNSIIGFVLIGLLLFGFTFWQSKQYEKQAAIQAEQAAEQARLDSIYYVEHKAEMDSIAALRAAADSVDAVLPEQPEAPVSIYKDAALESAHQAEGSILTLENDKVALAFTTKGAQPWSARIKDFKTYDKEDLYLFKEGMSTYSVSVYTGEFIKTSDFVFQVAEHTDTTLVMRLPFASGGYIEQRYSLPEGSYMVQNTLSFVGMEGVIPRNVSSVDVDFLMTIPRMEKGFKNESQYSKLDYYFEGDKKPTEIGRGRNGSKRIDSKLSWFAFQQQFFSAIIRSKQQFASGDVSVAFFQEGDESHNLMTCQARMREELRRDNPADIRLGYEMYFGPNHFQTLKSYDQKYEKIIPLGGWLVGWFTRFVIIPLFNFLHRYIGNFGIIILLMTIFIKIVVFPFAYKSYSSSAKMQALKPEMEKINAKYPKQEDAMKKQQATMDLYKKAGVSPMGGCLPMFLQFPILWAMFRFFPASIELRQQPFLWADDLSAYDSIINFGHRIPLLGDHISLFALLMAVSMWFYSKMTTANQTASNDPNAQSMKFMSLWMMPIMMYFICNSLSSGLSYYYLLSNLITMGETFVIKKWFVHPDEILAKVKASEGKPVQKSKWQLRLEEAQRLQQQQLREQQKKQGKR